MNEARNTEDAVTRARKELYAAENELRRMSTDSSGQQKALRQLLDIIEQINRDLNVERVLTVAGKEIIDIFEAERVFILDFDPPGCTRFRLAVDFKGLRVEHPKEQISHAVVREVAEKREPLLVADATRDPRFAGVSSVQHLELHSVMAAPLAAAGELLGVVYADNRLLSGAFDEHTLNLLGLLANHIGIALRNAQLFNELNAARAELAVAERLKTIGEMAAFIAHEVKNPLGSIKILLDALKDDPQDEELRARVFELVPSEVSRLNREVNRLLDYARPTPLVKVPVDVPELVHSALRSLQGEIEQAGISVSTEFDSGLSPLLADGERLRQVFINILKNSVEAMETRPKRELHISVRKSSRTRQEIVIEDTGGGIPENEKASIFEPFRSLKKTGTGLGLALCQKIVREHGGQITAENTQRQGTMFRVNLPTGGT